MWTVRSPLASSLAESTRHCLQKTKLGVGVSSLLLNTSAQHPDVGPASAQATRSPFVHEVKVPHVNDIELLPPSSPRSAAVLFLRDMKRLHKFDQALHGKCQSLKATWKVLERLRYGYSDGEGDGGGGGGGGGGRKMQFPAFFAALVLLIRAPYTPRMNLHSHSHRH